MVFNGVYWVLLDFTDRFSLGFASFFIILLDFACFICVLLGFTNFYWFLVGFTVYSVKSEIFYLTISHKP